MNNHKKMLVRMPKRLFKLKPTSTTPIQVRYAAFLKDKIFIRIHKPVPMIQGIKSNFITTI